VVVIEQVRLKGGQSGQTQTRYRFVIDADALDSVIFGLQHYQDAITGGVDMDAEFFQDTAEDSKRGNSNARVAS
jgi:hypothetical protein